MLNKLVFNNRGLFTMALCAAVPVHVTAKHRRRLEALARQRRAPQGVVMRARIVLLAAEGAGVRETAKALGIGRATVQRWRARWRDSDGQPFAERLVDAPRPGTPPTFTPEQICALIALACEAPSESERPFTH